MFWFLKRREEGAQSAPSKPFDKNALYCNMVFGFVHKSQKKFKHMQISQIRPAHGAETLLVQKGRLPSTDVYDVASPAKATLKGCGSVLSYEKVPEYLEPLFTQARKDGLPSDDRFCVIAGQVEINDGSGNAYNCIVVSFGHGREYALYNIIQRQEPEVFSIYETIKRVSTEKLVIA